MKAKLKFALFTLATILMTASASVAQDAVVDVLPLSDNCDWAVAPDGSGLVVSTTDGRLADYLVTLTTPNGQTNTFISVSDDDSLIDQFGDAGLALAAPFVVERDGEVAFALAVTSD